MPYVVLDQKGKEVKQGATIGLPIVIPGAGLGGSKLKLETTFRRYDKRTGKIVLYNAESMREIDVLPAALNFKIKHTGKLTEGENGFTEGDLMIGEPYESANTIPVYSTPRMARGERKHQVIKPMLVATFPQAQNYNGEALANATLFAHSHKLLFAAETLLSLMDEVPDADGTGQADRVFAQFEFDELRQAVKDARGIKENG